MRAFYLSLCFFFTCFISAQDSWLFSSNPLFDNEKVKEVIPIVNTESGEFAIFYKVKKGLIAELYSNEKKLLHTFTLDNLPSEDIVGYVDRKSTRLNSSHVKISYAVFC